MAGGGGGGVRDRCGRGTVPSELHPGQDPTQPSLAGEPAERRAVGAAGGRQEVEERVREEEGRQGDMVERETTTEDMSLTF